MMLISSLPQSSELVADFPSPSHLVHPEFIGNAIVHDGYNGHVAKVSLYQCNRQYAYGETKVVAVTEFGTSFVLKWRKAFELNCFIADEIRKQSNIVSVTFRSEWL
jgi:hypothetical protein